MSSTAQIEANRLNAQRSTGPRTPEGKAASCRNATTHGLLSGQVLIAGESQEQLELFRQEVFDAMRPQGAAEEVLADRFVAQAWRLSRSMRLARRLEEEMFSGLDPSEEAGCRGLPRPRGSHDEAAESSARPLPSGTSGRGCGEDAASHGTGRRVYGSVNEMIRSVGGSLEILRRYEGSIQRGMRAALRDLMAVQKERRKVERQEREDEEAEWGEPPPRRSRSAGRGPADTRRDDASMYCGDYAGKCSLKSQGRCDPESPRCAASAASVATRSNYQTNPIAGTTGVLPVAPAGETPAVPESETKPIPRPA